MITITRSLFLKSRSILIFIMLNISLSTLIFSDDQKQEFTLDKLRTPLSPGFVLLGVEPSSVERPSTPKALALNLLSTAVQDDFIPKNCALEVAPYWLVPHRKLTFDKYYNPNFWQTILQNLSFSLATSKLSNNNETISGGTAVGFGIRTQLTSGKANSKLEDSLQKLREQHLRMHVTDQLKETDAKNVKELKAKIEKKIKEFIDNPEIFVFPSITDEKIRRLLDDMLKEIEKKYFSGKEEGNAEEVSRILEEIRNRYKMGTNKIAEEIQTEDKHRVGLITEIAGAIAVSFPEDKFENGEVSSWGVWITPSYRPKKSPFNFIAVGRFIKDEEQNTGKNILDLGGRILYQYKDLALSGEFVKRFQNDGQSTYRIVGIIEYRLDENAYLTVSYGKNYEPKVEDRGNVIVIFGINFGFGKNPLIKF